MLLYCSEYCILWNGHPYLTKQSFILAVAVMFSIHVYLQIDVRTCIIILVIRYYVTTVLFTYPWVIYTIGLENEYLDDWDTGKNLKML